jgi:hypothetical protein
MLVGSKWAGIGLSPIACRLLFVPLPFQNKLNGKEYNIFNDGGQQDTPSKQ